jgi:predicted phage terminase large subunit-like protein
VAAKRIQKLKQQLRDEERLEKIKCLKFSHFFKVAWDVIEPHTPLVWNWHHEVIADELQRQCERIEKREKKEYDLIFNVPPRSLKSSLVSKLFLPYVWSRFPGQKFLTASYDASLALEHAVDSRTCIESNWYQRHWSRVFEMVGDQNTKGYYRNNQAGYRISTQVGSGTGKGGDYLICDDPTSADQAESEVYLERAINWWGKTMSTRLNNQDIGLRIVIMQRLHEQDLTGHLLTYEGQKYKFFCFPGELTDDVSPKDYRSKYTNGLLFPERFDTEQLLDLKTRLGDYGYAGQILQRPTPPEGGMFKRQWWRFWYPAGMKLPAVVTKIGSEQFTHVVAELPKEFDDSICSWDMGLKGKDNNDPSNGDVWAWQGPNMFLLDEFNGKLDSLQSAEEAKILKHQYPRTSVVLIEDESAGSHAIADLKRTIPSVQGVYPTGSKPVRARPMAAMCKNGNIYLPHPAIAPWVWDYIEEFAAFDKGKHDDRVDSGSQATNYMLGEHKVFREYNGGVQSYKIGFNSIQKNSQLLMSLWTEKSLTTSALFGLWSGDSGTLWVFDEFVSDNPRTETMIGGILGCLSRDSEGVVNKLEHLKTFQWYGSPIMFGKGNGDISESYIKSKIFLKETATYDEPGAITRTLRFLIGKKIVIHTRCMALRDQLLQWGIKKDRPDIYGYGLARALCQMVFALHESGKDKVRPAPKPYSMGRTNDLNRINYLAGTGHLNELVTGKSTRTKEKNKDRWMI